MPEASYSAQRASFVPLSETVLDAELHDAWVARLRQDAPEGARIEVGDRRPPVEVVEQIERLDAKLQRMCAAEGQQARHREIHGPVTRPLDAVAAQIAQRAGRRHRKRRRVQIAVE